MMHSLRLKPFRFTAALLRRRRVLAVTLLTLLFFQPAASIAEAAHDDAAALPEAPAPQPAALQIVILDGEGALNNIRERTAREPIVQVEDENHKPVAGALVLFAIHSGPDGAGASFNGASSLTATTDSAGRAVAKGLQPNTNGGTYTITVTASVGVVAATAVVISQTNLLGAATPAQLAAQQAAQQAVQRAAQASAGTGSSTAASATSAAANTSASASTSASTAATNAGTISTTTAGSGAAHSISVTHGLFHGLWKPLAIGGGVAGGVVIAVAVMTHSSGTSIAVGQGGVGHP